MLVYSDMGSMKVNYTAVSGHTETFTMLTAHPYLFDYLPKIPNLPVLYLDVDVESFCFPEKDFLRLVV